MPDKIRSEDVLSALSKVNDPELHKDLVTLNMIRDLEVKGDTVSFTVVLTTPACPLKGQIEKDARQAVLCLPGIEKVNVKLDSDVPNDMRAEKAFEQAAGFMRIRDAENPLDRSAVHPESYYVVEKMAKKTGCSISDLIEKAEMRQKINLEDYIDEYVGLPTLQDIMKELVKPGRDPRQQFELFEFDKNIHSIHDLRKGMRLPGIVTNITRFGAFVDIGVHQDGLVHISQLADKFVRDPNDVVKINQHVMVEVTDLDMERKCSGRGPGVRDSLA